MKPHLWITSARKLGSIAFAAAVVTLLGATIGVQNLGAAITIPVTTAADTGPDTLVPGSLREALALAEDGDTIDATGISGAITLMPGGTNSAQLLVDKNVTINGPGPANLTINANHLSRVFHITPGHTVTISGLTVVHGDVTLLATFPANVGGGIYNDHSRLTLNNCVISGNSAAFGGGVYNDGSESGSATLIVTNCTLNSNSALAGAGIYNDGDAGSAIAEISASTLSGNSATNTGGGVFSKAADGSATVRIANCTLSGNSANTGGAIGNFFGRLTIASSTFSGNSAFSGGIFSGGQGCVATIGSSILRAASSTVNIVEGADSDFISQGFNLSSDDGAGVLTATGDQINTDPMLGPLADNGGPTLTHLPQPGSPAIDQGTADGLVALGLTTDQRGFARTVDDPAIANASLGDGTDIGAVEVGGAAPPPPVVVADLLVSLGVNKTSVKQGDQLTYTITVHNFGPETAANVIVNDTLSSGTTFVSANANKGSFTTPGPNQTGVVTWNLGDLANGNAEDAQLVVTVVVRGKTSITNTAIATTTSSDPNTANNSASITTSVAAGGGNGGGKK